MCTVYDGEYKKVVLQDFQCNYCMKAVQIRQSLCQIYTDSTRAIYTCRLCTSKTGQCMLGALCLPWRNMAITVADLAIMPHTAYISQLNKKQHLALMGCFCAQATLLARPAYWQHPAWHGYHVSDSNGCYIPQAVVCQLLYNKVSVSQSR